MTTFFILMTLVGFIIGLGAVTVIDIHGFLARTSTYWTEATTRTHKITKPMIWIGLVLVIIGVGNLYTGDILRLQLGLFFVMIVNGIFLSFYVSPFLMNQEQQGDSAKILPQSLQKKITLSFVISVLSWWGSVAVFVYMISHIN